MHVHYEKVIYTDEVARLFATRNTLFSLNLSSSHKLFIKSIFRDP